MKPEPPKSNSSTGVPDLIDTREGAMISIDEHGLISCWNSGAEQLFGYKDEETIGKSITMLMPETFQRRFQAALDGFSPAKPDTLMVDNRTLPALHKDGSRIFIELSRSTSTQNNKTFFTGSVRDVTARYQREEAMTRKIACEQTIANVASRLVGPTNFDDAIDAALADIGHTCSARRAYLVRFDLSSKTMSSTHEWRAKDIQSHKDNLQDLPLSAFPWTIDHMRRGQALHVPDITKLPPEAAAERHELERRRIESLLLLPCAVQGETHGFVGVENVATHGEWETENIALLEVASSLMGSAMERAGTEDRLRESELRYRRLFESVPISIWQIDYSGIMRHFDELRSAGVSDFRAYFDKHPEAVIECTAKLKIKDVNKATLDLFKADSVDDFLSGLGTVFTEDSFSGFKEELISFAQGRTRWEGENVACTLAGERIHVGVKTFALPGYEKTMTQVYCAVTDITDQKSAEMASRSRIAYERVISDLASRFVAPPSLEGALDTTLKEIGEFTGAELGFLILDDGAPDSQSLSRAWRVQADPSAPSAPRPWRLNDLPWIAAKLKSGEAVRFSDLSELAGLPPEGIAALNDFQLTAMLAMPLFRGDLLIGCVGCSNASRPQIWREEDLSLLLVASSIISSALERQAADQAVQASEQKYRTLIEGASDAIIIADADSGLIIDVNQEAEKLLGRPAGALIGLQQTELHPAGEAEIYRNLFAEHVRMGKGTSDDTFVVNGVGEKVPVEISSRVVDINGKQIIQGVYRDITDRRRTRELRENLNKIISVVNSTLQFDYIIQRVIVEAAKALGAETAMTLLADGEDWIVKCVHKYPREMVGTRFSRADLKHLTVTARKRRPIVFNDALNDDRIDKKIAEKLNLKAVLIIPLIVREETIGCLSFCHHTRAVPFDEPQISFASHLGTAVSFALENARLYAEKRNIADALQQSLLTMPKQIAGIHFGNLYRSATKTTRVGGDFYDIFALDDDRVGLVIGDVSGKGLEAAKLTSLVKNTIRAYASEHDTPDQVIGKTNELTLQMSSPSTFVTVFFGVLDKVTGRLDYCNAGHPPALVKTAIGAAHFLETNSPAIGILPEFSYQADTHSIGPTDVLFLYTDGATDARRDNELFGSKRLRDLVANLKHETTEELPHLVFAELLDFGHAELVDDLALLSVSLNEEGA